MSLDSKHILYAGEPATEDDKRLMVRFTHEARLDRAATTEAGRNIYKNVEYVTINIPGDKTTNVHRPVMASDKHRFPLQYQAFRNNVGAEGQDVGTPLRLWPGASAAQVRNLEFFNVFTVEQLAAMPDGVQGASQMGVQALRQAARQYVENAKTQAPFLKMKDELAERDASLKALTDKLAAQEETLAKLIANLSAPKAAKTEK